MFEVETTAIEAVKLLRFSRQDDRRGHVTEACSERSLAAAGINARFVVDRQIFNRHANVVRGLHFQHAPYAQAKMIRVTQGSILDVALDLRPASPTFGQHVAARLSASTCNWLFMPEGFAHGFCSLEDEVEVQYKLSRDSEPGHECGVLWNDPGLAIDWQLTGAPVLAERDQAFATLSELVAQRRL